MSFRRLKIAFLVGKFPAISETFILNQITGLIDAGYEVDIFAQVHPQGTKVQPEVESYGLLRHTRYLRAPASFSKRFWKGLQLILNMLKRGKPEILRALDVRANGQQAWSLTLLYQLYPFLDRGPYDIIHCHFGNVGLAGVQLKDLGVPGKVIVAFHGQDISEFLYSGGKDVYRQLFEKADLLMPISEHWKQRLVELGADLERIRVHRMGINLSSFTFHPRSFHGTEELCLLTVSRLVEKKGVPYALQAVSRVLRHYPKLRIRYNIIGEGEQEEELRHLISEIGLQGSVHLLGPKTNEEIYQYMVDSHIFLLPSVTDARGDQEGIPVSLMEAMATGMPILSTLHSGIPELVKDGISGYLVPERDIESLVDRLERLIQHPETWAEMGMNGRRSVEASHNIRVLNQELSDIYQSLTSRVC